MSVERGQAEQGTTVKLASNFIQDNGALFDPFAIEKVEIQEADGTVIATYTWAASQITREALGVYYVEWPIPAAQTIGLYHDVWYWTAISGGNQHQTAFDFYLHSMGTFGAVATYMTVAEARERLASSTVLTDAQVLLLLYWAQEIAERESGVKFLPQIETVYMDGTGIPLLMLPKRLRQLTSLKIDGDEVDATELNLYPRKIVWGDWVPDGSSDCDTGCGSCSTSGSSVFPRGRRNISIEGLWGKFGVVPTTIKEGIKLLVARLAEEPMPFEPFAEETLPDWSAVRRRVVEAPDIRDGTGWSEISAMFAQYKNRQPKVSVI